MTQEGRRLTAQQFEQMRQGRRYATMAAFLLETEIALTDSAISMFEILIGKAFRQGEALRDKQLLENATSATSALDFFVSFGEAIAAKRETGLSLDEGVNAIASWEQLMQAIAAGKAASRTPKDDDLIAYLPARYLRIRRFAAPFIGAFTFEGNRESPRLHQRGGANEGCREKPSSLLGGRLGARRARSGRRTLAQGNPSIRRLRASALNLFVTAIIH